MWKDNGGPWCNELVADAEYAAAVGVIGFHYPTDFNPAGYASCASLGKPIWASEESSSFDDLNGAACWARVTNSHFVRGGITSSIMWNLIGAYAPGTSWFASSLMQAIEPWSGHYSGGGSDQFPVVWATAHLTQFAKLGWKYLDVGTGSGGWCWCERTGCRPTELFMTLPTYFRTHGYVTAGAGKLFHPDACSHFGTSNRSYLGNQ